MMAEFNIRTKLQKNIYTYSSKHTNTQQSYYKKTCIYIYIYTVYLDLFIYIYTIKNNVFFLQNLGDPLFFFESPSRQFHHLRRTEEVPFRGGATYHHHMLNFMSFAKKHFKRIVFFLYWLCFASFYGFFFLKTKTDVCKNFTQKLHHVFSSSNGLVSR